MLCYAMLCNAMLRHAMLCVATPRFARLCRVPEYVTQQMTYYACPRRHPKKGMPAASKEEGLQWPHPVASQARALEETVCHLGLLLRRQGSNHSC
eukprot:8252932-Pyramimonas_sp.AAC.1